MRPRPLAHVCRHDLLGNLSGSFLKVLTNLELNHSAGRNRNVLGGILGVAANLGLHFLHGEGAEVAQHNAITLTQSIGNQLDGLLDDVKHLVLRETVIQLSAYLVYKLSLSNRICHNKIALLKSRAHCRPKKSFCLA